MLTRRTFLAAVSVSAVAAVLPKMVLAATAADDGMRLNLVALDGPDKVVLSNGKAKASVARGGTFGRWTLTDILPDAEPLVVVEDFAAIDAPMLIVGRSGIVHRLSKTAESTSQDLPNVYLGHSWDEVANSPTDLLGKQILAQPGDPSFEAIAVAFPPIRKLWGDTYNFLGTPGNMDKVWFAYGGRSPNFDPAVYHRPIEELRKAGKVLDGLLGGYLPVLRFVYPEGDNYTEMLAFAPFRTVNDNPRFQPVWYRVARIEGGKLIWTKHIDSYLPYPPRTEDDSPSFYRDLLAAKAGWDDILAQGMQIDLPDERLQNIARHSLIRSMMGRSAGFPKYGVVDKNYGGSEHDGFPDTFTVETEAMLEWGLIARAGDYIDNYFGRFVRDDGVILYRGPETGQFGRMLTVVGQYANNGGDAALLKKHAKRIDAIADVLLSMRAKALTLPKDDPAYGVISGWSEADAVLEPDPARYMQPYFSNSAEAARGFRDLGRVWQRLGFAARGARLVEEAEAISADMQLAMQRSTLTLDGESIIPTIAGAKEPFHVVLQRDRSDPQWRSYRSWMEMLHSGLLTREQIDGIIDYRARHHDVVLGMPMAYGYRTGEMAGFLSYGHGYGLIQNDRIRDSLLMTYSSMAHQYTRGMWVAPETRRLAKDEWAAPYCGPAQLVAPLMLRWLLVFEDPQSETLWLGKCMPSEWLADGEHVEVKAAPTRWGRVGFRLERKGKRVAGSITLPATMSADVRLRIRQPLKSTRIGRIDEDGTTIILPAGSSGTVPINVSI